MGTYTPGPWRAEQRSFCWEVRADGVPSVLADVYRGGGGVALPDGQEELNARLMAAAPTLLEALLSIWQRPADERKRAAWIAWAKEQADAAIASATGEAS